MKIFLFYIMVMANGDTIAYKFKDGFTNNFDCLDRRDVEIERARLEDVSDILHIEYVCSTKDSIGSKLP